MSENIVGCEKRSWKSNVPDLSLKDFIWLVVVILLYIVTVPLIYKELVFSIGSLVLAPCVYFIMSLFFAKGTNIFSFLLVVCSNIFALVVYIILVCFPETEDNGVVTFGLTGVDVGAIYTALPMLVLIIFRAKKIITSSPAFCFLTCCWVIHLLFCLLALGAYMMAGPS